MAKAKKPEDVETSFGNASQLFAAALEGAPDELRPLGPYHGGGPPPKIDATQYVTAVLWCADKVKPFVSEEDRLEFQRMVSLAKQQLRLGRTDKTLTRDLLAASRDKSSKVPMRIAAWTCHEAHNWSSRPIYAGGAARPAAKHLVALVYKKQGAAAVTELFAELDSLCVHLEALYMLANHKLAPTKTPTHTLWRGSLADKAAAWILGFADDRLALISKIGARWTLTEGDRAFVLAHVADSLLDGAAAATDQRARL